MAKATTPGAESKPKPATTRKPAAKAAAVAKPQETGADAPVSSTTPPAVIEQPTPPEGADSAAPPAPADEPDSAPEAGNSDIPAPTGMGRFPDGWQYEPGSAEQAQTPGIEGAGQAVQSPAWELPGITDFPAELTLVNNTRHLLIVRPLCVRVDRFGELKVVCPTAGHYDAIKRDFSGRAVRERWDSQTGLQVVIHGDDQG